MDKKILSPAECLTAVAQRKTLRRDCKSNFGYYTVIKLIDSMIYSRHFCPENNLWSERSYATGFSDFYIVEDE